MEHYPLPVGDFEWGNVEKYTSEYVLGMDILGSVGALIECDLSVPKELHDYFNDYPLAPDRMAPAMAELSPYTQDLASKFGIKENKVPKLNPNFLVRRTTFAILPTYNSI